MTTSAYLEKSIIEENRAMAAKAIDDIFEATTTLSESRPHLPEAVFRKMFLPYFSGQLKVTPENNIIGKWVSVAINPHNEVDVVDIKGEVVFTVPGIISTDIIDAGAGSSKLSSIVDGFLSDVEVLPVRAINTFNSEIQSSLNSVVNMSLADASGNRAKWEKIFEYYNIPLTDGTDESTDTNYDLDDISYD
jgi:hypothetical protein